MELVPGQQAVPTVAADLAGALQPQAAQRPMEAELQYCHDAARVRAELSVKAALRLEAATLVQRTRAEQQVFLAGPAPPQCQPVATKTWWPPAHEFGSPLCVRRQQSR